MRDAAGLHGAPAAPPRPRHAGPRFRTFDGLPSRRQLALDRLVLRLRPADGRGLRLREHCWLGGCGSRCARRGGAARSHGRAASARRLTAGKDSCAASASARIRRCCPGPAESSRTGGCCAEVRLPGAIFLFVELTGLAGPSPASRSDSFEVAILLERSETTGRQHRQGRHRRYWSTPAANLLGALTTRCRSIQPADAADRRRSPARADRDPAGIVGVAADGAAACNGSSRLRQPHRPARGQAGASTRSSGGRGWFRSAEPRARIEGRTGYRGDRCGWPWSTPTTRHGRRASPPARHCALHRPRPADADAPVAGEAISRSIRVLRGLCHVPGRADAAAAGAGAQRAGSTGARASCHGMRLSAICAQLPHFARRPRQEEGARALRELLDLYAVIAGPLAARRIGVVRHAPLAPGRRALARRRPDHVRPRARDARSRWRSGCSTVPAHFCSAACWRCSSVARVAINTFTRTIVTTVERGEIMRWPIRIGERHLGLAEVLGGRAAEAWTCSRRCG